MVLCKGFWKKRSLHVPDDARTKAADLTLAQSLYPFGLVTVLFFIWGFSYGLLDTLNKHFQDTLGIQKSRSAGLQAAYFGAYPLASLGHAAWILRRFGYRAVFIWGLFLYGLGSLLAIPAIKTKSFGGFCACIFVIGNGLGSLETAANPYITVCGPSRHSEIRLNVSQAFTGMGAAMAPVLGSYVFNFGNEQALDSVQWVYLSIASVVLALAVVFFLSKIPEITDADMAFQAAETGAGDADLPFRKQYRLFHAAFAQFCYTGAQAAIAGYFINYVTETRHGTSSSSASRFLAGSQGTFATGRYAGALLMHWVRPRIVLGVFLAMCIVFTAPAVALRGDAGMAMLFVTMFFSSVCFPTILALGIKGLGRHTKRGSGYLVGAVSGGACVPPLMGAVADSRGTALALVVSLCFFAMAWTYALAVNFWPSYRDTADAFSQTEVEEKGEAEGQRCQVVANGEKSLGE